MKKLLFTLLGAAMTASAAGAPTANMVIRADRPGAEIQPTMYGLFFEDINYAADGGLYAELVKNRSFEFPQSFMGWDVSGKVRLKDDGPFERAPHYVTLDPSGHREKHTGITNHGFFGIGVKAGETYDFSVWARGNGATICVELADLDSDGETQVIASQKIAISSDNWQKYTATLRPDITIADARLRIFLEGDRSADLEHISLFPADTWKGRKGGLRRDLAQALYDIHPGVLRFPGGCIVEGTDSATRYRWKNTVGPVENRPVNENRWHYTFRHRFFPDYYQSGGLGFYEYFQLAEDIGAEPLPILNCGLICQYQNDEEQQIPIGQLDEFVQDALDLIEFANGAPDTDWGKVRAAMGHPEPFNMKYLGIGNEQWGFIYPERLKVFVDVLRKAHPEIKIVGSSGPYPEGEDFDYLWKEMKKLKVDLVDEHFYRPESWFLANGNRYDSYDRKGPKVFAGEYACHGVGKKRNHFNAALLEAAFMTGLERNADIVHMATYAPLFAHVEGWQWRPDMIWYDNLNSARSASYYVQQLYVHNRGSRVLPLTMQGKPVAGAPDQNGLFASAATDATDGSILIKVANTSDTAIPMEIEIKGLKRGNIPAKATVTTLHADSPDADNLVGQPEKVTPVVSEISLGTSTLSTTIGPRTFCVYRIK